MRNFLRAKISISFFSVFILVLIPLLRSNFNAPITIKRWGKLNWDDFQGFVKPFTGYDAAISSDIYLEYDSTASRFSAYAGQNNVASWTKKTGNTDEYGLNHEQYHFNITEIHARILNGFIEANPGESENFYRSRLQTIWYDLRKMHKAYDDETDHSLIRDRQRRWEYKIDSLLNIHAKDSGWVTDYYSGAKTFFPAKPTFSDLDLNNPVARSFTLSKYDMTLSLISYQYEKVNPSVLENNLRLPYQDGPETIEHFSTDYSQYPFKATVISKDSSNIRQHSLWLYDYNYLFKLSAQYPCSRRDTSGYVEIAQSFLNSFQIENTDIYWQTKFKNSTPRIVRSDLAKNRNDRKENPSRCVTYSNSQPYGFFRGPFYSENGDLYIVYDIIKHADTLIFENSLILNRDLYSSKAVPDYIYFIPGDKLPKDIFKVNFGYTLVQDSTKECYIFYNQQIEINPERRSLTRFQNKGTLQF